MEDEYKIRRMAIDFNVPVVTTLELAKALFEAIETTRKKKFPIKSLNEYYLSLRELYW